MDPNQTNDQFKNGRKGQRIPQTLLSPKGQKVTSNESLYKSTLQNFYKQTKPSASSEQFQGYKVSVQISKEKSFDENYKEKFVDFINKFHSNGHFDLSVFLPHMLSEQQIQDFKQKYQDLDFQIEKINFDEGDFQFYQRVYQFKGQDNPKILPRIQMLIFDHFIFDKLKKQTKEKGFNFNTDYHTAQCSVTTPNTTFNDPKESMKYFTNNILNVLNNYDILEISTKSQQECLTKNKLITSLKQKLETDLDTKIELVQINLSKIKLDDYLNNWMKEELKNDRLYVIIEKDQSDLQTMNAKLNKFIKENIKEKIHEFTIEIEEVPDQEELNEKLEKLKQKYSSVSIQKDDPKQKSPNKFLVDFWLTTWHKSTTNPQDDFEEIKNRLHQIYKPFLKIKFKDQEQISIWKDFLKDQLPREQAQYISDDQSLQHSQYEISNFGCYAIKISTKFQDNERLRQQINQQLEQLTMQNLKINIESTVLSQPLKDQKCDSKELQKLFNINPQNLNEKILQIILVENNYQALTFQVIYQKKFQKKDIEEQIKTKFINQLQVIDIDFRFDSIYKKEFQQQLTNGEIVVLPSYGIAKYLLCNKLQFDHLYQILKSIKKNIQEETISIKLKIENNQLGNELKNKLNESTFINSTYQQENCLLEIGLLKHYFEKVNEIIKEFIKKYEKKKSLLDDKFTLKYLNEESQEVRALEKSEKIIINFQRLKTFEPNYSVKSCLCFENKRVNLVQGKISEIQCEAIVLQFLKSFDYSNVNFQNDQIKNILMQADKKEDLENRWKKQMDLGNELKEDVIYYPLSQNLEVRHLFQIYPNFYENASSLKNNLKHILDLIKEVFKQAKNLKLTQIAFPLIGVELFGYNIKAIQQVLIQQILHELSQKECTISQVFVVDDCEDYLNSVDIYFKTFQEQKRPDSGFRKRQNTQSQIAQWQIEKGGMLIPIEEPEINDLISIKNQQLRSGKQIDSFVISYPYSKYPGTHMIDPKKQQITEMRQQKQMRIDFIDFFEQRLYFFDYQQVEPELNKYLVVRYEQSKQEQFDLFYAQDEIIPNNQELFIQTKNFNNKKKIICSGKQTERQDWIDQEFPFIKPIVYQQNPQFQKQQQVKQSLFQIDIYSDSDQTINKALCEIKKISRKISKNKSQI
ncbi:unnamed protein product [Paramecium sonneborni]|uniref:Macro domain-containing protein n=1 Tax=Paramecium sonneborni TaxID=65129 RepID=A0A8S1R6X9_9CILI|nr:unnamed protein product [Paramecium sonneborni]